MTPGSPARSFPADKATSTMTSISSLSSLPEIPRSCGIMARLSGNLAVAFPEFLANDRVRMPVRRLPGREASGLGLPVSADAAEADGDLGAGHHHLPELPGAAAEVLKPAPTRCRGH